MYSSAFSMDSDLYDEFGNYIGPDLDSDEDDDQSIYGQPDVQDDPEVFMGENVLKCIKNHFFPPKGRHGRG